MSHDLASQSFDTTDPNAFLANLRHELRTPLNAMIGYSEMLLEEVEELSLEEDLQQILTFSQQLLSLINTILSPASLEEDSVNLNEFSSKVQAELLAPINVVVGHCECLLTTASSDLIPDLTKIHTAAQSLQALVNGMVHFSQKQLAADRPV
jgi:sigma-B regulation protein RsbU (phosphoserine phosphatase)